MPIGFGAGMRNQSGIMGSSTGMSALFELSMSKKVSSQNASQRENVKRNRSKKEIHDIIQCNESNMNTFGHETTQVDSASNPKNLMIDKKNQKTYLNELYNQDIAPEDSQKTLFYYLKTLVFLFLLFQAYEMIIVLLSFVGIFFAFVMYYEFIPGFSDTEARQTITLITGITIITAFLQTQTRIKWLKEKKEKENSATDEYISLLIEILLLLPCPNNFITGEFTIKDEFGLDTSFNYDELFTVFVLGRVIYVYKFIIHSELYYGSRPDRLSRLYTVKFGTFNSFKFLINEKPLLIVIFMFSLNLFFLPMLLLLIQGKINPGLSTFMACLHYTVVTQVTVGYGNILVRTFLGRIVSISFILIGVTSTSLLLIFFMRLMEQSSQEEEAHLLLSSLEKREEITKARVLRIQTEYLYSKIRCTPEQKQKHQQKLRQFRFQNRRNILFQRQQPANVKRMMLSNFASVIQMMNELKQKQSILAKIVEFVIKTSNHSVQDKVLEDEMLGEDELDKLFSDKKKKMTLTNSKNKKKNELMIENNSALMIEKLGNNIKKTIINKS